MKIINMCSWKREGKNSPRIKTKNKEFISGKNTVKNAKVITKVKLGSDCRVVACITQINFSDKR